MSRKETLKALVLGSLALYLVLGILLARGRGEEAYPFFSWFLFERIPNPEREYTIDIHMVGDKKYEPALPFWQAGTYFSGSHSSPIEYFNTIQRLGLAIEQKDEARIARERALLEAPFGGKPLSYDVSSAVRNPLDFYKTQKYRDQKLMITYSTK